MKILFATDGSDYSKTAVENIGSRPLPPNTKVHIVSAFESSPLGIPVVVPMGGLPDYYTEAFDAAQKSAEEAVKNAAAFLCEKNPSLDISTKVINGSPKLVILNEADEFGADLIVVGSHGRGVFKRFLLGSVSQAVALHANCSVEIVRNRN